MFGASSNTTPAFGSTSSAPAFGSSTGGFGQASTSAFGAPSAPFGSPAPAFGSSGPTPSPFGAPAPSGFGGFGAPAPAPTGFGGFGAPAPAPSGFGGFGAPAPAFGSSTASPFGAPAPAPSGGLFGAPAPAPSASPFGAPAPAGGGLFGAPAPAPAFGAASSGPFGAPAPAPTSAFSFGAPAPAPAPTGGLFGAPAPAPAGGLFGSAPAAAAGTGSKAFQYNTTRKQDGSTSITLMSMTAMPQYESKSFEEIRLEDYTAGNKGSAGATATFGGFGAPAPAPSSAFSFGAPSAFGAPAPAPTGGLFGAPAPAPSGGLFGAPAPAPSAFGAPAPATGFGFGASTSSTANSSWSTPAPAPFAFGAPAPAPTGGLFGAPAPAPATGSLFGTSSAPSTSGGLFGAPAPAPASSTGFSFGAPASAPSGGLFGAPAPAPTGGLFGAPAPAPSTGFSFGAPAPAPTGSLFGAPAPAPTTGLFGAPAPAPTGGLFGSSPAPAPTSLFGAPAPAPAPSSFGGFGFGSSPAPAPSTGGLFGAPAPAPSMFGGFGSTPAPAPGGGLFGSSGGGGLFGAAPAPAPTSLFGGTSAFAPAPAFGQPPPPQQMPAQPVNEDALLAQKLAAIEEQKQELERYKPWKQSSTSATPRVIPVSLSERAALGGGTSLMTPASAQRPRIVPRGLFGPMTEPPQTAKKLTFESSSPVLSPKAYLGSTAKQLVIQPTALAKSKLRLVSNHAIANNHNALAQTLHLQQQSGPTNTPEPMSTTKVVHTPATIITTATTPTTATTETARLATPRRLETASLSKTPSKTPIEVAPPVESPKTHPDSTPVENGSASSYNASYELYKRAISTPSEAMARESPATATKIPSQPQPVRTPVNGTTSKKSPVVPKLTKPGYKVSPSLSTLEQMSEADLAAVSNFVVSRPGYGRIAWEGDVDVRNVDLDSVVVIEDREVSVYDEYETTGRKPPVGSKLNRPAIITLEHVFPKDGPSANEETLKKFGRKVAKQTAKSGADFISYDSMQGIWTFRTHHFSKYGLAHDDDDDDDDDDDEIIEDVTAQAKPAVKPRQSSQPLPLLALTAGQTLPEISPRYKQSRYSAESILEGADTSEDEDKQWERQVTKSGKKVLPKSKQQKREEANAAYILLASAADFEDDELLSMDQENELPTISFIDHILHIISAEDDDDVVHDQEQVVESQILPVATISTLPNGEVEPNGICAQIWRECAPGNSPSTSSSKDYGLRMGRSFRPTWTPNGHVVHSGVTPGNLEVRQFQRCLVEEIPQLHQNSNSMITLLQVHLDHSKPVGEVDGCPMYALPQAKADSYEALCKALDEYVAKSSKETAGQDPEIYLVGHRAFSLLSALYGQENDAFGPNGDGMLPLSDEHSSDNNPSAWSLARRRREGFLKWLQQACRHDTERLVAQCKKHKDFSGAIVAALAGGDFEVAVEIATQQAWYRLATLISVACFNTESSDLIDEQMTLWRDSGFLKHLPPNQARLYCLLGGNLDTERALFENHGEAYKFDWRQRLSLQIWSNGGRLTLDDALTEYADEADSGSAPKPIPRYARSNVLALSKSQGHLCILYQLLKARTASEAALRDVLMPLGYSSNQHDFQLAFHLAACIHALGCFTPLDRMEWSRLKDSFCGQLVTAGLWHWAVYVCLCAGPDGMPDRFSTRAAKTLILQNLKPEHSEIKLFLAQKLSVPKAWLEEALALRHGYQGDALKHVVSLKGLGQMSAASLATEILLIPAALLLGGQEEAGLRKFLETIQPPEGSCETWDRVNGCGAVLAFLTFSRDVQELFQLDQPSIDIISAFLETAKSLKQQLCLKGLRDPSAPYWVCVKPLTLRDEQGSALLATASQVLDSYTCRIMYMMQQQQQQLQ